MGQIVKRKKKGRPSKADLADRSSSASERHIRRSLRRRNVKCSVIDDYDDEFIEDDEEGEEEEEVRRREKKVKLVVKLHSNENARSTVARGAHAQGNDEKKDEDEEVERGNRPLKKRKINGVEDTDCDSDNIDDNNDNRDDEGNDDEEVCIESCAL